MARTEVPRKPLELLTQGYQHFRVLATALEFRLFTLLPSKGATIPEIARLLGLKERPARTLVNAVAVLALIEKRGNRFRNTRLAATYLVEGHPQFYGDFIRMMDRRLYHAYENLGWALREEKPVTADPAVGDVFRTMARDPEMTRLFTMGMDAAGRYWAECLARSVDLSRTRLLLDVGGGSGVYSIALAKRFRKLRAIIFDLPEVLPVTRERIRAAGLEDRVETTGGDFFADPWPSDADAVLFSAVLHDWSPDTCRRLLRRAAGVLPAGGIVVIRESFSENDGPGPLYAAMSNVTILLETEGENYPWKSYESWLREAGFGGFRRIPFRTTAASGALVARKLRAAGGATTH